MRERIVPLLHEYGLDEKEADIFLHLVENGQLTAYKIAKDTGIHRSTTYDVLGNLEEKGFVSRSEKHGTSYFSANEMTKIIASVQTKETILTSLIPDLEKLQKQDEPKTRILEGELGRKQFNMGLLTATRTGKTKDVLVIDNYMSMPQGLRSFVQSIVAAAIKENLHKKATYRCIWNESSKGDPLLKQMRIIGQNRFMKDLPSKATIFIYGNNVAFLPASEKTNVIEVTDKNIADEMRAYFEILWKLSR